MKLITFVALISLTQGNLLGLPKADYNGMLHIRDGLDLTWDVFEANATVKFQVTCQCTGWVGIGLNNDGFIVPADIVMGGVGENGPYFLDRWAVEVGKPNIDKSQDWFLLNASEEAGITKLEFYRAIDTGDSEEDLAITDQTVYIVWAVGVDDFIAENVFDTPYHGPRNRGNVSTQILRSRLI